MGRKIYRRRLCRHGRLSMSVHALLLLLIVFAGSGCSRHEDNRVVDTTLCDVGSHAASYEGKRIKVSANVLSDGIEHTLLFDPSCSGTKVVVVPGPPRETDLHQLRDVIFWQRSRNAYERRERHFRRYFSKPEPDRTGYGLTNSCSSARRGKTDILVKVAAGSELRRNQEGWGRKGGRAGRVGPGLRYST